MAVTRVWGLVDGQEIHFSVNSLGQWEASVPADADKTFVVELWAEDEAGNVGYFATVLFTFDPISLEYRFAFLDTEILPNMQDYSLKEDGFDLDLTVHNWEYTLTGGMLDESCDVSGGVSVAGSDPLLQGSL